MKNLAAFISFEELGFGDYIIFLKENLVFKKYPLNKYTAGDLKGYSPQPSSTENKKIFKELYLFSEMKPQESSANGEASEVQNNTNVLNQIIESRQKFEQNLTESLTQNILDTISTEVTSIENLFQTKLEQSNSIKIEEINEIEKNLNFLNSQSSTINSVQIHNLEQKLISLTKDSHHELKENIEENKKSIEKFLNS